MPLLAAVGASVVVALLRSLWQIAAVSSDLLHPATEYAARWTSLAPRLLGRAAIEAIWAATSLAMLLRWGRTPTRRATADVVPGAAALLLAIAVPVGVELGGPRRAVRCGQLRGDDACVEPQGDEPATPVVRAGAGFHHHHAARG